MNTGQSFAMGILLAIVIFFGGGSLLNWIFS